MCVSPNGIFSLHSYGTGNRIGLELGSMGFNIFTARKRSLRGLCFYTCLSVILFTVGSTWAGTPPPARYTPPGRYIPQEGTPPPGKVHPPWPQCMLGYGQQAGGTHPTGMHSCMQKCSHWYKIGTGTMNHWFYLCQSGSRPSGPVLCSVNKP